MATAKKRRTKGSGSIVKRGKVYYLVIKEDGKVVSKKSLRTGDRKTAEQKAEELLPNFDLKTKEEFVAKVAEIRRLKSQDKVKLSQAWEMFYTSKFRRQQTAEGTLSNYKRNYERFLGWLNRNYPTCKTLSEITLKIAEEYAQDVEDMIISNSTYNYHIRGMATITNVLMHDAGISENVWERIPRKPNDSIGKKAFTEEEVGRLLEAFDDESLKLMHKEQMKILFCIALFTGMRLADCALLLWRDIDLKSGMISLMPVKTKGSRKRITAPLTPAFREKLQEAADSWGMVTSYRQWPNVINKMPVASATIYRRLFPLSVWKRTLNRRWGSPEKEKLFNMASTVSGIPSVLTPLPMECLSRFSRKSRETALQRFRNIT